MQQVNATYVDALANAAQVAESERLSFTDTGAEKAAGLIANSGKEDAAIRVFVKSGGCSGYQYGMAIEDRFMDGDLLFEDRGVRVVVDERSWPLLRGSRLDYVENMMGGGFSVENPQASSNCGCGHSFRTDGRPAPQGPDDSCS